jgi:hypothetical protein
LIHVRILLSLKPRNRYWEQVTPCLE